MIQDSLRDLCASVVDSLDWRGFAFQGPRVALRIDFFVACDSLFSCMVIIQNSPFGVKQNSRNPPLFLVRSDDVRRYLRCPYAHARDHRYRDWDGTQPWRPGERHRSGDNIYRLPCAVGGILVDAGRSSLYAGGMRRWVRTAVIDVYMGGGLAMILECAEQAVRHDTVPRKAGARWKENYKSCSQSEKCRCAPQNSLRQRAPSRRKQR